MVLKKFKMKMNEAILKEKKKKKDRHGGIKQLKKCCCLWDKNLGLKTSMKFSQTSWQRAEKLHKV